MLSYSKCKELKDAGYNRATHYAYISIAHGEPPMLMHRERYKDDPAAFFFDCACPTLEELIEALSMQFYRLEMGLVQSGGLGSLVWTAHGQQKYLASTVQKIKGNTPAEAVANLWLALNAGEKND